MSGLVRNGRQMGLGTARGIAALLVCAACACAAQRPDRGAVSPQRLYPGMGRDAGQPYLGFDRNDYPGDDALAALRKSFDYAGYWLNNPPGETGDSWAGKRAILRRYGFGFLAIFNGRTDAEIRGTAALGQDAGALGAEDGRAAADAAAREGFPKNVLIFLDQEEGGRLLPEQAAYLFAWVDAVRGAGARAGVYCSGIEVPDSGGTISTADDIAERESTRIAAHRWSKSKGPESHLALWIANDECPPAPGCRLPAPHLSAALSPSIAGLATVWQYAQSPRRKQFSASCPANQAADGNCYAPGLTPGVRTFVDLDTADSPDPSEAPDANASGGGEASRPR
jgi:hypothetical protein